MLNEKRSELKWMLPFFAYFLACAIGGVWYSIIGWGGSTLIVAGLAGLALAAYYLMTKSEAMRGNIGMVFGFLLSPLAMVSWFIYLPWEYEPIYDIAVFFALLGFMPFFLGMVINYQRRDRWKKKDT